MMRAARLELIADLLHGVPVVKVCPECGHEHIEHEPIITADEARRLLEATDEP